MGAVHLTRPVVGMAADRATGGYWLVAADGGVFTFDAPFEGSAGALGSPRPWSAWHPPRMTGGYWLVAADGGVFAYGDARFAGSMGAVHLTRPVVGMAADPATGGLLAGGRGRRDLLLRRALRGVDRRARARPGRGGDDRHRRRRRVLARRCRRRCLRARRRPLPGIGGGGPAGGADGGDRPRPRRWQRRRLVDHQPAHRRRWVHRTV